MCTGRGRMGGRIEKQGMEWHERAAAVVIMRWKCCNNESEYWEKMQID